ncbi:MAG TPA: late competence development ComFB family protein [Gemmatimonadales bacterium]|nr:late competence development ComFB family protein [Gemmatimonadales bacterium]
MIQNLVEEHVLQAYDKLRPHFPDFCGCEMCRADVLVYALNRLPARYVASRQGTVISELDLEKDQSRARIDVALMEGFRIVGLAPRCKHTGAAAS